MQQFSDRRVVLTGAAGGIGTLVAARLAELGAHVTGIDRLDSPACDESLIAELTSPARLGELSAEIARRRVDLLINLAGIQYFGPFAAQNPADIAEGYAVNMVAPAVLARAVLPQMQARGQGQIVNIGSVFGAIPFAHFVTYSSAKAGLRALSEALRRELKGSGVVITHVAPRAVKTPLNSAKVLEFARISKMNMDPPEHVAERIVEAIGAGRREVVIGFPESLFVRVNALLPALVDRALAANDRKAAALFQ